LNAERCLVREGEANAQVDDDRMNMKLFLFNDIVCMCIRKNQRLKLKFVEFLSKIEIYPLREDHGNSIRNDVNLILNSERIYSDVASKWPIYRNKALL
jgi:hypothetical protein